MATTHTVHTGPLPTADDKSLALFQSVEALRQSTETLAGHTPFTRHTNASKTIPAIACGAAISAVIRLS
jgi:hypothetical protein